MHGFDRAYAYAHRRTSSSPAEKYEQTYTLVLRCVAFLSIHPESILFDALDLPTDEHISGSDVNMPLFACLVNGSDVAKNWAK